MDAQTSALAALGMSIFIALYIALAIWVLYIIAFWKVFTKAGEPGWKSIIPIYNIYIFFKITWKKTVWFWVLLACSVVYAIMISFGYNSNGSMNIVGYLATIPSLAAAVISIIQLVKASYAYGHGAGFAVGLVFLDWIFLLVLGFGSSQYIGPQD